MQVFSWFLSSFPILQHFVNLCLPGGCESPSERGWSCHSQQAKPAGTGGRAGRTEGPPRRAQGTGAWLVFRSEMRRVSSEVTPGLEGLLPFEEAMPFDQGGIFAEKPTGVEEEGSPEPAILETRW